MHPPKIPNYSLGDLIGEGSTGSVWTASYGDQGGYALKAFKGLAINRQLLSDTLMKLYNDEPHEGIAKIFDFDLASPQAYVTMELFAEQVQLADGRNTFRPRNLEALCGAVGPNVARELTMQIAEAMAVLHRRRIPHCNLKPSNILFEPAAEEPGTTNTPRCPRTKISDIGLGMLGGIEQIDPGESLFYASPEQIRDPDHFFEGHAERWDVYAFGATIFRLFTGRFPRLDQEIEEFRRNRARELDLREPVDRQSFADALSTAGRMDWPSDPASAVEAAEREIINDCLSIDPADRPVDMREVLERFRDVANATRARAAAESAPIVPAKTSVASQPEEPLSALPVDSGAAPAQGSRKGKGGKKLPLALGLGAAAAAGIAAFFIVDKMGQDDDDTAGSSGGGSPLSSGNDTGLPQADEERTAVETKLASAMDDLRQSEGALDEVFALIVARDSDGNAIYTLPEGTLGTILNYYDEFISRHGDDEEMSEQVARALNNSAELNMILGDHTAARTNLLQAVGRLEGLEAGGGETGALLMRRAHVQQNLAEAELSCDRFESAVQSAKKANDLFRTLLDRNPSSAGANRAFARSSLELGRKMTRAGQGGEAGLYIDRSAGILEKMVAANQVNEGDLAMLAATHFERGRIERQLGDKQASMKSQIEAIDRYLALSESRPDSANHSFQLARAYSEAADLASMLGEPGDANSANKEASNILSSLASADPANGSYRFHLAKRLRASAQMLRDTGSSSKAREQQDKALVLLQDLHKSHPKNPEYCYEYSILSGIQADLYGEASKKAEAVTLGQQAVGLMQSLLNDDLDPERNNAKRVRYRHALAALYGKLGHHQQRAGNKDTAQHCFEKALKQYETLVGGNAEDKTALGGIDWAKDRLKRLK